MSYKPLSDDEMREMSDTVLSQAEIYYNGGDIGRASQLSTIGVFLEMRLQRSQKQVSTPKSKPLGGELKLLGRTFEQRPLNRFEVAGVMPLLFSVDISKMDDDGVKLVNHIVDISNGRLLAGAHLHRISSAESVVADNSPRRNEPNTYTRFQICELLRFFKILVSLG